MSVLANKGRNDHFHNPDLRIKNYPGENDNGRMVKDEVSRLLINNR